MRKLVYYIAVSLDGYIAGPGGEYDFYPGDDAYAAWMGQRFPETIPTHIRAMLGVQDAPNKTFDTVLMGRGTYEIDTAVTNPYAHLKQYVVSSTLEQADPAITLVRSDPIGLVRELKQQDGLDIYLCGGGKLAGELLPEIDQLIIKSYPVIAGAGIPMIDGDFQPTGFTPAERESFDCGVFVTWYSRK
ncbi:dihydrofolate reductase [Kibdelosporangium banguiense]|uniref:Dihydrofolate reductase n=1 Tax=Kibdelosporangium banguiense TaxID=1365924 RepID=A0ABS4TPC4_9PSEU|nr:dihydrofolate reductase family protein [Kibdelosporangium banguiense]MBP2326242.1 dihydrofolate reductase [Kibdelosporangium banguiense]